MDADLTALKDITRGLYTKIKPLAGTDEASKIIGIGAGGDKTKYIDTVAENFIFISN